MSLVALAPLDQYRMMLVEPTPFVSISMLAMNQACVEDTNAPFRHVKNSTRVPSPARAGSGQSIPNSPRSVFVYGIPCNPTKFTPSSRFTRFIAYTSSLASGR